MLFRKDIPQSCEYCIFGKKSTNETMLCAKQGNTANAEKCKMFSYDPCKRIPSKRKPLDFSKYTTEDFSL